MPRPPQYTFGSNGTVTTPDGRIITRPARPPIGSVRPQRPIGLVQQVPPRPGQVTVIGNASSLFPQPPPISGQNEQPPQPAPVIQPDVAPISPQAQALANVNMRPGQLPHMVPTTNQPAPLSIAQQPNFAPPQAAPVQMGPQIGQSMNNGNGLIYTWDGTDWKPDQAAFAQYMQQQGTMMGLPQSSTATIAQTAPPTSAPIAPAQAPNGFFGNLMQSLTGPLARIPRTTPPALDPRLTNYLKTVQ